jgi:hypothetical protein
MKQIENKIREICTYYSEPDEISGVESAGTAGYCLSEEQFQKLFNLFSLREQELWEALETKQKLFKFIPQDKNGYKMVKTSDLNLSDIQFLIKQQ